MGHGEPEEAAGVREGEVLAGKYLVEKVLGAGGMGIVVAARHLQLDTHVAIKFLLPALVENEEAVARFAREARAAVKITGEHVARVLDVGTLANGAPYLVMEFLEGIDLGAWLRERGRLPVELAVDFLLQACVAVAEAHSLGIVHRDLKPANLFCVRRADGQLSIKVLDFGISKVTSVTASFGQSRAATQTSAIMGTPLYMSPEQMSSARDVDARTDIWALGVILHELLAGSVPFQGDTLPEVCVKVATSSPTPLRQVWPDAPAGVEAIILRCLEKDREARYRNVGELALALGGFAPARGRPLVDAVLGILRAAGQSVAAPRAAAVSIAKADGDARPLAAGSIPPFGWTEPGTKRKAWGWLGVGSAAVTVAAVVTVALMWSGAIPRPQPSITAVAPPSTTPTETHTAEQPTEARLAPAPAPVPAPAPASSEDLGGRANPTHNAEAPAHSAAYMAPTAPPPRPTRRRSAVPDASDGPAPARPSTQTAVNCNPPFFFDEQGSRVFKKECVN